MTVELKGRFMKASFVDLSISFSLSHSHSHSLSLSLSLSLTHSHSHSHSHSLVRSNLVSFICAHQLCVSLSLSWFSSLTRFSQVLLYIFFLFFSLSLLSHSLSLFSPVCLFSSIFKSMSFHPKIDQQELLYFYSFNQLSVILSFCIKPDQRFSQHSLSSRLIVSNFAHQVFTFLFFWIILFVLCSMSLTSSLSVCFSPSLFLLLFLYSFFLSPHLHNFWRRKLFLAFSASFSHFIIPKQTKNFTSFVSSGLDKCLTKDLSALDNFFSPHAFWLCPNGHCPGFVARRLLHSPSINSSLGLKW